MFNVRAVAHVVNFPGCQKAACNGSYKNWGNVSTQHLHQRGRKVGRVTPRSWYVGVWLYSCVNDPIGISYFWFRVMQMASRNLHHSSLINIAHTEKALIPVVPQFCIFFSFKYDSNSCENLRYTGMLLI